MSDILFYIMVALLPSLLVLGLLLRRNPFDQKTILSQGNLNVESKKADRLCADDDHQHPRSPDIKSQV
jgi:hypothetical protein